MFYTHGYSRPIQYRSYNQRLTKPDILSLRNTESDQLLKLLEKYGRKATDFGGLRNGIKFGPYLVLKSRQGYSIHCQRENPQQIPEQSFGNFDETKKKIETILENSDGKDSQEQKALIKIFAKHNRKFDNQGWRNKIVFGSKGKSYANKKGSKNAIFQLNDYFLTIWKGTNISRVNMLNQNGPIKQDFATFEQLAARIEQVIEDAE